MKEPRAEGPHAAGGLFAVADAGAHAAFLATDFSPARTAASTCHTTLRRTRHAWTLFHSETKIVWPSPDCGKQRRCGSCLGNSSFAPRKNVLSRRERRL